MTLVPKLDLDMVKIYHHINNEISMSWHSKVIAQHTHTHTHTQNLKTIHECMYAGAGVDPGAGPGGPGPP